MAFVSGPSETSKNCGFVVSAAGSRDPSIPPQEATDFLYRWSCQTDAQDQAGVGVLKPFEAWFEGGS